MSFTSIILTPHKRQARPVISRNNQENQPGLFEFWIVVVATFIILKCKLLSAKVKRFRKYIFGQTLNGLVVKSYKRKFIKQKS